MEFLASLGTTGAMIVFGFLGLLVGSFLNVVIHRLPKIMEAQWDAECAEHMAAQAGQEDFTPPAPALTLSHPHSRCPQCGHGIRWFENIPVLSWLVLRGRCSQCQHRISVRYPLVEITTALLFAWNAAHWGPTAAALVWCGFSAVLLALALIDWDTTLLPDSMTQPLAWAGLLGALLGWLPLSPEQALWGAVGGYMSLWSISQLFRLVTGREGMGAGDFKLLAALGAWLGPAMLLPIVLGASVIGAIVGIGMKLAATLREGRYVPFGPFLAGGALVVMLAGSARVLGWMGWT